MGTPKARTRHLETNWHGIPLKPTPAHLCNIDCGGPAAYISTAGALPWTEDQIGGHATTTIASHSLNDCKISRKGKTSDDKSSVHFNLFNAPLMSTGHKRSPYGDAPSTMPAFDELLFRNTSPGTANTECQANNTISSFRERRVAFAKCQRKGIMSLLRAENEVQFTFLGIVISEGFLSGTVGKPEMGAVHRCWQGPAR